MSTKSNTGIKIAIVAVVLVVAVVTTMILLRPVARVSAVSRGTATNAVPGSVVVNAEFTMELKSEIGGRVLKSELDVGKPVKQGAILVQIDTGDISLEIDRIQTDLESAKKSVAVGSQIQLQLETAKSDLDNAVRQNKLGSLSEADLKKQQRVVKQFEQQVELEKVHNQQTIDNLENSLKTKVRQREKMTITAPFDGVISDVLARPGDLIQSSAPIANLIATSRTVVAKIAEENFSGIKLDQRATVRFLGYGDTIYEAKVSKILPTADPQTQRYIVFLDVKITPELLIPGITGEALIYIGERPSETIVPRRALFGHNVFVVTDGKVEQRHVQLGYTSLNQVELLQGVKSGELVIVEELDRFHPGQSVRTELLK